MFVRRFLCGLAFVGLGAGLIGCANPSGLDSIQVSPTSQSLATGQTVQLSAMGTFGNAKHSSTQDVTSGVTWTSTNPAVATVNASGLVTGVGAGTSTITAKTTAFNGPISSSATITVTSSGTVASGGAVASIAVIPGVQSVATPGQTSSFIAIGTTTSGATTDLTSQVKWSSSSTQIATINTSGTATAVSKGSVTITALYNGTGGTAVIGTGTFVVTGGTTQQFTAVTIVPSSQTISTLNGTAQFIALATSGTTGLQQDVTNSPQLKWSSSAPTAGFVSPTGQAKDLAAGASTITAELTNSDGSVVSNTATLTTTLTASPQDLLSLTIIPSQITVGNLQGTGQFLAIGTFATPPYVRDLTNRSNWISSAPNVFPVTTNCGFPPSSGNCPAPSSGSQNGGVVSAYGNGSGVIVAEAMGSDGTIQTATANFNCPFVAPNPGTPATSTTPATPATPGSCFPGSEAQGLLSTLTVYNEGLNTNTVTNWLVTAPSATGTPNVLHCGPGWTNPTNDPALVGSVCTATYPVNTPVTLTAPNTGAKFGGWSANCLTISPNPSTATGPNTCTVVLTSDDTVGAIFN